MLFGKGVTATRSGPARLRFLMRLEYSSADSSQRCQTTHVIPVKPVNGTMPRMQRRCHGLERKFMAMADEASPSTKLPLPPLPILRNRRDGSMLAPDQPHRLESAHFQGTFLLATQAGGRQLPPGVQAHLTVRGTFSTPLACDRCFTGQLFDRPLRLPPANGIVATMGTALLRS